MSGELPGRLGWVRMDDELPDRRDLGVVFDELDYRWCQLHLWSLPIVSMAISSNSSPRSGADTPRRSATADLSSASPHKDAQAPPGSRMPTGLGDGRPTRRARSRVLTRPDHSAELRRGKRRPGCGHRSQRRRRQFNRPSPTRRQSETMSCLPCRHAQREDHHRHRRHRRSRDVAGPRHRRRRQRRELVGETRDVAVIGDVPYGADQEAAFGSLITRSTAIPRFATSSTSATSRAAAPTCTDERFAAVADASRRSRIRSSTRRATTSGPTATGSTTAPSTRSSVSPPSATCSSPQPGATLGRHPKHVDAQPGLAENVRWVESRVAFATLHVIGSNNGLSPVDRTRPHHPDPRADGRGRRPDRRQPRVDRRHVRHR